MILILIILIIILIFLVIFFQKKIRNEKLKYHNLLINSIPLPLFIKDFNGNYIDVNYEFERFFKIDKNSLLKKKFSSKLETELDIFDKIIMSDIYLFKKHKNIESLKTSEIDLLTEDEKAKKLKIIKSLYKDINFKPIGIIGIIIDSTHQKEMEDKLLELSIRDELTKVYNRRYFNEILSLEIERARRYKNPLSLIYFDIDHFKKINDNFGHQVGDLILKELTSLISKNIRKIDLLFRIGGEEFVILLINTNLENTHYVAEKLRKIIEKHEFPVIKKITVSFGCTQLRENDTFESFINRADEALYKAKNSGRNRVVSL